MVDEFSKLSLGQVLVQHGIAAVDSAVDVKSITDESMGRSEREAAYAQVDTLCNLSVQQSTAGGKAEL